MLKPGGSAIIATFALDGPEKCSGLLVDSRRHVHTTPWGATQAFQYSLFKRR
jgi:hypothetical protein